MEAGMDIELIKRLRPLARQRAGEFSVALSQGLAEGRNIHHLSIDLQDEFQVYLLTLPDGDRETFEALYAEELNANAAQKNQQVEKLFAEAEATASAGAEAWRILSAIVGVVAVAVFFFYFVR